MYRTLLSSALAALLLDAVHATITASPYCTPYTVTQSGSTTVAYCTCSNSKSYSAYCDDSCPWSTVPPKGFAIPTGEVVGSASCLATTIPISGPKQSPTPSPSRRRITRTTTRTVSHSDKAITTSTPIADPTTSTTVVATPTPTGGAGASTSTSPSDTPTKRTTRTTTRTITHSHSSPGTPIVSTGGNPTPTNLSGEPTTTGPSGEPTTTSHAAEPTGTPSRRTRTTTRTVSGSPVSPGATTTTGADPTTTNQSGDPTTTDPSGTPVGTPTRRTRTTTRTISGSPGAPVTTKTSAGAGTTGPSGNPATTTQSGADGATTTAGGSGGATGGATATGTGPSGTDGATTTYAPIFFSTAQPTSTITSLPTGYSIESVSTGTYKTGEFITTTKDGDDHPTVVPLIFGSGGPVICWDCFPGIDFPPAPSFSIEVNVPELPCIKIFGISIGDCGGGENSENNENNQQSNNDPTTNNHPSTEEPTKTRTTTASSCTATAVPSCSGVVSVFTPSGATTATTTTSTECRTITTCGNGRTTMVTSTASACLRLTWDKFSLQQMGPATGTPSTTRADPTGPVTTIPATATAPLSGIGTIPQTEPPTTQTAGTTTAPPPTGTTTAPLNSESPSCNPTGSDLPSLPDGDIMGQVTPFCQKIDGSVINQTAWNYTATNFWNGGDTFGIESLTLSINWKSDCYGMSTIQADACNSTFAKAVYDCGPTTAPSGELVQKWGGSILGDACVVYSIEIGQNGEYPVQSSPSAPPPVSTTPAPVTTAAQASTTEAPPATTTAAPPIETCTLWTDCPQDMCTSDQSLSCTNNVCVCWDNVS